MKCWMLFLGAAALALAGAAQAKGPSAATIEGPGLDAPVVLKGDAESDAAMASPFYRFVHDTGWFAKVFCCPRPNPLLPGRPQGNLGPKYTVSYDIPGPDNKTFHLAEALYPYAVDGPVSYMRLGLSIFEGMHTNGGWVRSPADFKARLVALGLPAKTPSSSGLSGVAWAGIGIGGLLALLGGGFAARRRLN